jgi:putative DNA primase/helicase
MMQLRVKDRARGKWFGILTGIGIDPSYLRNEHGPCPLCGTGRDRWRWDDKSGDGTFYCNQCVPHAGSGVDLVMRFKGLSFHEAALLIESLIGRAPVEPQPVKPNNTPAKQQARKDFLNELWRFAKPVRRNDVVDRWLRNRGIELSIFPAVLRCHPSVCYRGDPNTYHPAMIAMVTDPSGKPVTIHKTHLTADGQKAPVADPRMFMPGTIPPGSAVRLMPAGPKLAIAEGIETAMAVMKLFGLPCWAALDANKLERFEPPPNVEQLLIMADNDTNGTGQTAAEKLAKRLSIKCEIHVPNQGETDWNDVWRSARK